MTAPFHLAFPVHDLAQARAFYGGVLGCAEGRSGDTWIDFNLYGHQIVAHLADAPAAPACVNRVDGREVPVPHFGVVLDLDEWAALALRLERAGARFLIEPCVRFRGGAGEQSTLFVLDPSGNALEFKAFARRDALFRKDA